MTSNLSPFAGKPYVSGAPGVNARKSAAAIKTMPAPALARLAHAISRIPNAPKSRGNGKELFLP